MKYDKSRENILLRYYQICKSEVYCNTRTAEEYKCKSYITAIPRIVISSLIGSSALVLEYIKDDDVKAYSLLGIGALGITNALIGTLEGFFGLGEKSQIHRNVAQAYNNLGEKIKGVLALPRRDRPDVDKLLEDVKIEFNRINEISLEIPGCIVSTFQRKFKDKINNGYAVSWYINGLGEEDIIYHTSEEDKDKVTENPLIEV